MVQAITPEGLLPCKYVVADSLYGQSPDFVDALDACMGGDGIGSDSGGDARLEPTPPNDGPAL